jgi:hypothetical protein
VNDADDRDLHDCGLMVTTKHSRVPSPALGSYWRRGSQLLEFESLLVDERGAHIFVLADSVTFQEVELSQDEFEAMEQVIPAG